MTPRPSRLADLPHNQPPTDHLTRPPILATLLQRLKDPTLVHRIVTHYHTWHAYQTAETADVIALAGHAAHTARLTTPADHLDLPGPTTITTRYEPTYPHRLLDLSTPPILLYSTAPIPTTPALAIIGPLVATPDAASYARQAAASAVMRGIPVIAVLDDAGTGHAALDTVCRLAGTPIAITSGDVSSTYLRHELASRVQQTGGLCLSDTHPTTTWSAVHNMTASALAAALAHTIVACDPGLHPAGGSVGIRTAITTSRPLILPHNPTLSDAQSLGSRVLTCPSAFSPDMYGTNPDIIARVAQGLPPLAHTPTTAADLDSHIAQLFTPTQS